jgi:hypothetical protein
MPGGIAFKETMQGWFALDATTPEEGVERARAVGTKLALHADVAIDDVDRFVTIREHPGGLGGSIDFQPLGIGLRGTTGVFQLFAPDREADSRRMVYELGFLADGRPFYFAGEKRVRNDPGLDLWRDTTTLFSTLHEGADRSGRVVGAGILTLGVRQLMALISTMKATNGGNAMTIAAFGRFFFGELWELYAPHLSGGS